MNRTVRIGVMGMMGLMGPMSAGAAPDPGVLQQSANRQEQIRGEARELEGRLDDIIGEYERNGLGKGDDFTVLKNVRTALGSLSDEEMEKVVALLRAASGKAQGADEQAAQAYDGQKDISLRLKQILAAHEREQDLDALGNAVSQLADRQGANLGTALDAKQLAAQDNSANGQTAVKASEEAQQGEQGAIAGEVKLLADKLSRIAADGQDPKYTDASTELGQAQQQAAAASDALSGGKIDDAVTAETAARQQLARVALALAPVAKQQTMANDATGQLASLAGEQRALLQQTKALNAALARLTAQEAPAEVDKAIATEIKNPNSRIAQILAPTGVTASSPPDQIKNAPEMQKFIAAREAVIRRQEDNVRQKLAAQADDESALATKAQMVREDLDKTAKQAAAPMADALTQMNSAQDAMAQGDADQAMQAESDAATQLDAVAKLAGQENPDSAQGAPAESKEQEMQELQGQVQDLAGREAASIQQGDAQQSGPMAAAAAAVQQNLEQKAEAAQQAAANQGSGSAQPLQQAAQAMTKAAQAMQSGGTPDAAQAAQQKAADNLDAAKKQLAQEAGALGQEKQQLATMQMNLLGIDRLIQQQQQVNLATAKAVEVGTLGHERASAIALGHQQGGVRRDTHNVRTGMDAAAPAAIEGLDAADSAMGDAVQQLDVDGPELAQPPEKDALAALYKAQDGLAEKIEQTAQDLGQPAAAAQVVANVEATIAKAQEEAAAAEQAIGKPRQGEAELNQAAQRTNQAGTQPQALPQGARDALRQAQQAFAAATAAEAGGDEQQARAQAEQGGQALQAAQAALQQMQGGIGELGEEQGQQGQQGQDGQQGQQGQDGQQGQQGQDGQQGTQASTSGKGGGANENHWTDAAGAVKRGLAEGHGGAQFLALPERDRAAVQQSQAEKYPAEYGPMIEEYMRSLASDTGGK